MMKRKSTKRALLLSALSLLMCISMLIGSTFAWFTDSVTSGSNVIKSGNLDIVVDYTLDGQNWAPLDGANDLFQKGLWEPGHTEVVVLRIKNNGSLALKYVANMNIVDETVGKTKDNTDIVLSEILTVKTLTFTDEAIIADAFAAENNIAYAAETTFKNGNILEEDESLLAGALQYIAIEVDMAETVGNEANHNGTDIPQINFGVNIFATQFTYEKDSFGDQYDANITFVNSAADLLAAFDIDGANIVLEEDVVLDQNITVDKAVTLNLNGKTLTTMGLTFTADTTVENGTITSGGNTNFVPHLKIGGGSLTMNDVTVEVNHHLNFVSGYSEAAGLEVQNAKAVLNNCDIKVSNTTKAKWVFSYAVSAIDAEVIINGGKVTAECVDGTAANGPTNPNALCTIGACTITLNDVDVDALYYAATVRGHATINTTDTSITSANIVDNAGGSHTINYIA